MITDQEKNPCGNLQALCQLLRSERRERSVPGSALGHAGHPDFEGKAYKEKFRREQF